MPVDTSKLLAILVILALLLFGLFKYSGAQTVDELKTKINDRTVAIEKLEQEIKQYQIEIDSLGQEANSLKNTLKSLDISKKKLEADTKITENKIAQKNLEIKELSLQIGDKAERITDSKRVISQSLYNISQMSSGSIVETVLGKKSFSEIWNSADELNSLQANMQTKIKELENLKANLEVNKKATEKKKAELVVLTNDLKNQTKIIADTAKEKNSILTETKNTEANYKKLLATRKLEKDAFEKELHDFEAALKIAINPNSIPSAGSGILKWPVNVPRITQKFGITSFSPIYPHTGVDFGVSIGTPVKTSLNGTIVESGNMDASGPRCKYSGSYGKWILVKHGNGLSTLYAHLSLINVSNGQSVSTGEVIGYSGNTGNSTGPHLHFTVFASEGVSVQTLTDSKYCRNARMPRITQKGAYLDPLKYLP